MGKQQWNSSPLHDCERVISLLHQSQSASNAILSFNKLYCILHDTCYCHQEQNTVDSDHQQIRQKV